jgi:hypothetical protein
MNALRAPLTALHVSMREYSSFSLDSADAFIDIRLTGRNAQLAVYALA